ncbi:MAG TPA: tetratricopeptide repeat protein [Bryobacteraceae bacterium]|nr:tetratricopeptide repeat protein [Bryobacteraceae bacterium]
MALVIAAISIPAQTRSSLEELITLADIQREEFEPAIGEQIRSAYEEAARRPDDAEATGRLGMIFQCYGKYEWAAICYRRAQTLAPRSARWSYYLGNVEAWLGKDHEAAGHLRQALKLDARYTPGLVRLGQFLFESGDLDESRLLFEEAIRQQPRFAAAHLGLGRVLASRGEWAAAIASCIRACDIFPNYAAARYALAMAYRKTGQEAKAREQLDLYTRAKGASQPAEDPWMDAVNALYRGGMTHFAKGSALAQQGRPKEAAAQFESALEVNPRLMMAHVNLIAMYGQMGLMDKAEKHFQAAVSQDPGWAEIYYNWGLVLARQHKSSEAAEQFRKAIEANPNYAEAHMELGQVLEEGGRIGEAQHHFRLAVENAPSSRQARYLLGRSLIRTGPLDEAIAELRETIQVEDDKTPVCMQALAAAYQRAGNLRMALHYAQEARQRCLARRMDALAAELQLDIDRLSAETKAR